MRGSKIDLLLICFKLSNFYVICLYINKKILNLIRNNKAITQEELADKLNVSRATINNNIKILKENGYVDRVGSNNNDFWNLLK